MSSKSGNGFPKEWRGSKNVLRQRSYKNLFPESPLKGWPRGLQVSGSHSQRSSELSGQSEEKGQTEGKLKGHWFLWGAGDWAQASHIEPLLLSYTLSPHFLFWDRVSLSHPGLEFLILLPPPSKQLRWQAGLCNRNHTSWFKKNNTLLYPKQHLKIRNMKECKWEWGLHCIWNNAVIRGLWGVICVY